MEALRAGELVVFPTETVYGLGANAANPPAVRKIFEVKGRPPDHPVIVHLDHPRYLHRRLGFTHVGHFHEVGYKFGRWLDLVFLECRLPATNQVLTTVKQTP